MNSSTGAATSSNSAPQGRNSDNPKTKLKKPKYSKFWQQQLPTCRPVLTPQWVISGWFLLSLLMIPLGVIILLSARNIVEIVDRYDEVCLPDAHSKADGVQLIQTPGNKRCVRILNVPKHMKAPIHVYYQLENFNQNNRRYVKSVSQRQMVEKTYIPDKQECRPKLNPDPNIHVVPCGLIAWSLFNDTYTFSRRTQNLSESLSVNKIGISWESDRNGRFGKDVYPRNFQTGPIIGGKQLDPTVPLNQHEDLIVWMRPAALPTFRKLYGRIEVDLSKNDKITVNIENNYNVYSFSGKKSLVLSTANWLGGKSYFLGIACLSVGGICLALAIGFTIIYIVNPRKLGDPSRLSWNRKLAVE